MLCKALSESNPSSRGLQVEDMYYLSRQGPT